MYNAERRALGRTRAAFRAARSGLRPQANMRRRQTLAPSSLLAGAAALHQPHWLVHWLSRRYPDVLFFADTTERRIALTIDDGPCGDTTPALLDLMRRYDSHATFFLLADGVVGDEPVVRRIAAEGHEIGNHLLRDLPSIKLPPHEFESQLVSAHRILSRFAAPRWFRPGSAWFSRAMLESLGRHGYRCVLGSVYPYDAHLPWPAFAKSYILGRVRPGAIVILHDGKGRGRRTLEVLQEVLPRLRARGYRIGTVSELVRSAGCRSRCSSAPGATAVRRR
jgi:peptidoglycan/xylan/chitin deacetylase (PgdA/CDA1 family)